MLLGAKNIGSVKSFLQSLTIEDSSDYVRNLLSTDNRSLLIRGQDFSSVFYIKLYYCPIGN